jgi:hypothetical protein
MPCRTTWRRRPQRCAPACEARAHTAHTPVPALCERGASLPAPQVGRVLGGGSGALGRIRRRQRLGWWRQLVGSQHSALRGGSAGWR